MWDACGMAGGNPIEVFNAGAYNATRYAKQGDLGSQAMAREHQCPHTHGLAVERFVERPR